MRGKSHVVCSQWLENGFAIFSSTQDGETTVENSRAVAEQQAKKNTILVVGAIFRAATELLQQAQASSGDLSVFGINCISDFVRQNGYHALCTLIVGSENSYCSIGLKVWALVYVLEHRDSARSSGLDLYQLWLMLPLNMIFEVFCCLTFRSMLKVFIPFNHFPIFHFPLQHRLSTWKTPVPRVTFVLETNFL